MKWSVLGAVLRVACLVQREPERSALARLAEEVRALDAPQPRPTSSR